MKRFALFIATLFVSSSLLTSCYREVGPYEETEQSYGLTNFDRLDMGSAFTITVQPGTTHSVVVKGNRRDIDDLDVYTRNGTLHAEYRNHWRSRRYDLAITITMPTLRAANFSGASRSTVSGFRDTRELDVWLSGASKSVVDVQATRLNVDLSGAADLELRGSGTDLRANLSGASDLQSVDYPVASAELDLSGASFARISATRALNVRASGASSVRYRGTPELRSQVSGGSTVRPE